VGAVACVTIAAPGARAATPATTRLPGYVALGDSFTSGPGLAVQLGATTGPSAPPACLRSSDNYPSLAARALRLSLRDASCAGATTADLTGSQGAGIPAQLSALRPSTALVSLGIGGNDIGFATVAADCVSATPWGGTRVGWSCRAHYTAGGVDRLAAAVRAAGVRVTRVLGQIRARAPHARVFVVGYPAIVPPTGAGCWPRLPFAVDDLTYLRGVEADLDAILAADATAAGDTYVDTATPSAAHNACAPASARWVEPLLFASGAYPLHPSAAGMAGVARLLEQAMSGSAGR
jgi:lysophospholipase L1-like esterase